MKKNIIKILITLVFVFTMFGGISAVNFNYVKADQNPIKYVALGDSIADGTRLEGYQKYTFVDGSYTNNIKENLELYYDGQVESTTYAMASSNTTDFLALLNGQRTDRYADLNTDEVLQTIKDADIITVCIGANDILLPAINNIMPFIMGQATVSDMEAILANGLVNFTTNYPKILAKLTELNPDAIIVFNDIYNPYKCFKLTGQMADSAESLNIFNVSNINKMGEITETYLSGGVNSQEQEIIGLNQLMERYIYERNNENFKFVEIKKEFDMVANNDASQYSQLVNVDVNKIQFKFPEGLNFNSYADPHPTQTGHELIASAIMNSIENDLPYLDESVEPDEPIEPEYPVEPDEPVEPEEPTYVTVTFVVFGGYLADEDGDFHKKEIQENTLLTNYQPIREGYPFGGWYEDASFNQKWNPEEPIVKDMTLYAKWITLKASGLLEQDITNVKEITFKLDIPDPENYDIFWLVQEGDLTPTRVEGEKDVNFKYLPTKSGVFKIQAEVDGVKTSAINVTITRSKVSMVKIVLKNKDVNNKFTIEVVENSYSDSQLVWYQSSNEYKQAPTQICVGKSILEQKFNSSCKIWVVYKESGEVISNVLDINVEQTAPTDVIIGVLVSVLIVGAFIVAVVITKKKYSDE